MKEIFEYIYGLLLTHEPDVFHDNSMAQEYHTNKELYYQKALNEARGHAFVKLSDRFKELGQEFVEFKNIGHPQAYIDPLTKELMSKQASYLSNSGTTFERNSIVEHIKKKNTDPITHDPLTIEQLIPNKQLHQLITEYKKTIESSSYWFNQ